MSELEPGSEFESVVEFESEELEPVLESELESGRETDGGLEPELESEELEAALGSDVTSVPRSEVASELWFASGLGSELESEEIETLESELESEVEFEAELESSDALLESSDALLFSLVDAAALAVAVIGAAAATMSRKPIRILRIVLTPSTGVGPKGCIAGPVRSGERVS